MHLSRFFFTVFDYFNLAFRFSFKTSHKYSQAYIALHSEVALNLRFYATVINKNVRLVFADIKTCLLYLKTPWSHCSCEKSLKVWCCVRLVFLDC